MAATSIIYLYLSTDFVIAWQVGRQKRPEVKQLGRWHWEIEGVLPEGLADFFTQQTQAKYFLLLDFAEEEFHLENIPPLTHTDRQQVLERKLSQRFRDTPIKAAWPLEKLTQNSLVARFNRPAGPQTYVLSGLVYPPALESLNQQMIQRQLLVAGALTPTHLYAALAKREGWGDSLIAAHHPAGLRLVYVRDGSPRFSRLAINNSDVDNQTFLADEIQKTLQYLQIGRFAQRDELTAQKLNVHIVDTRPAAENTINARWANGDLIYPHWHPATQFASTVETPIESVWALLQLDVFRGCGQVYEPLALTHSAYLAQTRKYAWIAASLIVIFALGWALWQLPSWLDQRNQIRDNQIQTKTITLRYEEIKTRFPNLPLPADSMQAQVALFEALSQRGAQPAKLLQHISAALEKDERINLKEISWLPLLTATELAQRDGSTESTAITGDLIRIVTLSGTIENGPSILNKEATNLLIHQFSQQLTDVCACVLNIVRLPYDENPQGFVAGKYGAILERLPKNEFLIEMRYSINTASGTQEKSP